MSCVSPVALACNFVFAVSAACGALHWNLPRYATLDGSILTVDVPENDARAGCRAWAEIDLSAYDGIPFEATIEAWGERIGKPRDHWNGLKFQFEYRNPDTGETLYPNTKSLQGDFARRMLSVRDTQCSHKAFPAHIVLGLQDTSGKVSFDLSTLRIRPGRICWPVTNQNHRCEYTTKYGTAEDLRRTLRGVMAPSRDMTEDDLRTLSEWGVTLIRYQMACERNFGSSKQGLDDFDSWVGGRLDHLDAFVLPMAEKYGIQVAIDLHRPPGGREASGDMAMFHNQECADRFIAFWRRVANRFRGRRAIYGYDLVNEPVQTVESLPDCDFWSLQKTCSGGDSPD